MGALSDLADQIEDRTKAQQMMIDDGLPPGATLPEAERREAWKGRKLTKPRDIKAPPKDEDATTKALRKEMAAAEEAKKAARFARLKELKGATMSKKPAAKPAKASKAAKAASAPSPKKTAPVVAADGPRPGSMAAKIGELLTRKEGATRDEILEVTGWKAVNVPRSATQAGLKITKTEKKDGPTRYWAKAA